MLNCECPHVFPKQVNVRRIPQRQGGNPFDACSPGGRKLHRRRESSCVGMVGLTGHTLGAHEHACVCKCIWNSDNFESRTYFMLVSSAFVKFHFLNKGVDILRKLILSIRIYHISHSG